MNTSEFTQDEVIALFTACIVLLQNRNEDRVPKEVRDCMRGVATAAGKLVIASPLAVAEKMTMQLKRIGIEFEVHSPPQSAIPKSKFH